MPFCSSCSVHIENLVFRLKAWLVPSRKKAISLSLFTSVRRVLLLAESVGNSHIKPFQERESSEKLRIQVRQLELDKEQLQKQLVETQTSLREASESATRQQPKLGSMDSKEWKTAVLPRMMEDKMKGMEEDLNQKVKE